HSLFGDVGDVDLPGRRAGEVLSEVQYIPHPGDEGVRLLHLAVDAAVVRAGPGHGRSGALRRRVNPEEVIYRTVDPAHIPFLEQGTDVLRRDRQCADEVTAGQGEDSGLEGVEHREQEVRARHLIDLLVGEVVEVAV